jgi:hypothetical protein
LYIQSINRSSFAFFALLSLSSSFLSIFSHTNFLLFMPENENERTIHPTPIHSCRRTNSLKKPNPHRPCIRAENQENADANMQMQHRKVT